MVGINRWKDMNTTEHELYDSLIGDFSISQRFSYHPKDGRALVFGLGISLDLVYVYSQGIQLQPGLMFNLGAKL